MPSSSSFWAMTSLSSTEKETDSPCVPSRRVVSNVKIFMLPPWVGRLRPVNLHYGYAHFLFLLQKRHHFAKLAAHGFNWLVLCRLPHREKILAMREAAKD